MDDKKKQTNDKKIFIITPDELAKLGILDSLQIVKSANKVDTSAPADSTNAEKDKLKEKNEVDAITNALLKKILSDESVIFKKPIQPKKLKATSSVKKIQPELLVTGEFEFSRVKKHDKKSENTVASKSGKFTRQPKTQSKKNTKSISVINKKKVREIKNNLLIKEKSISTDVTSSTLSEKSSIKTKRVDIISNTPVSFSKEELSKIVEHFSDSKIENILITPSSSRIDEVDKNVKSKTDTNTNISDRPSTSGLKTEPKSTYGRRLKYTPKIDAIKLGKKGINKDSLKYDVNKTDNKTDLTLQENSDAPKNISSTINIPNNAVINVTSSTFENEKDNTKLIIQTSKNILTQKISQSTKKLHLHNQIQQDPVNKLEQETEKNNSLVKRQLDTLIVSEEHASDQPEKEQISDNIGKRTVDSEIVETKTILSVVSSATKDISSESSNQEKSEKGLKLDWQKNDNSSLNTGIHFANEIANTDISKLSPIDSSNSTSVETSNDIIKQNIDICNEQLEKDTNINNLKKNDTENQIGTKPVTNISSSVSEKNKGDTIKHLEINIHQELSTVLQGTKSIKTYKNKKIGSKNNQQDTPSKKFNDILDDICLNQESNTSSVPNFGNDETKREVSEKDTDMKAKHNFNNKLDKTLDTTEDSNIVKRGRPRKNVLTNEDNSAHDLGVPCNLNTKKQSKLHKKQLLLPDTEIVSKSKSEEYLFEKQAQEPNSTVRKNNEISESIKKCDISIESNLLNSKNTVTSLINTDNILNLNTNETSTLADSKIKVTSEFINTHDDLLESSEVLQSITTTDTSPNSSGIETTSQTVVQIKETSMNFCNENILETSSSDIDSNVQFTEKRRLSQRGKRSDAIKQLASSETEIDNKPKDNNISVIENIKTKERDSKRVDTVSSIILTENHTPSFEQTRLESVKQTISAKVGIKEKPDSGEFHNNNILDNTSSEIGISAHEEKEIESSKSLDSTTGFYSAESFDLKRSESTFTKNESEEKCAVSVASNISVDTTLDIQNNEQPVNKRKGRSSRSSSSISTPISNQKQIFTFNENISQDNISNIENNKQPIKKKISRSSKSVDKRSENLAQLSYAERSETADRCDTLIDSTLLQKSNVLSVNKSELKQKRKRQSKNKNSSSISDENNTQFEQTNLKTEAQSVKNEMKETLQSVDISDIPMIQNEDLVKNNTLNTVTGRMSLRKNKSRSSKSLDNRSEQEKSVESKIVETLEDADKCDISITSTVLSENIEKNECYKKKGRLFISIDRRAGTIEKLKSNIPIDSTLLIESNISSVHKTKTIETEEDKNSKNVNNTSGHISNEQNTLSSEQNKIETVIQSTECDIKEIPDTIDTYDSPVLPNENIAKNTPLTTNTSGQVTKKKRGRSSKSEDTRSECIEQLTGAPCRIAETLEVADKCDISIILLENIGKTECVAKNKKGRLSKSVDKRSRSIEQLTSAGCSISETLDSIDKCDISIDSESNIPFVDKSELTTKKKSHKKSKTVDNIPESFKQNKLETTIDSTKNDKTSDSVDTSDIPIFSTVLPNENIAKHNSLKFNYSGQPIKKKRGRSSKSEVRKSECVEEPMSAECRIRETFDVSEKKGRLSIRIDKTLDVNKQLLSEERSDFIDKCDVSIDSALLTESNISSVNKTGLTIKSKRGRQSKTIDSTSEQNELETVIQFTAVENKDMLDSVDSVDTSELLSENITKNNSSNSEQPIRKKRGRPSKSVEQLTTADCTVAEAVDKHDILVDSTELAEDIEKYDYIKKKKDISKSIETLSSPVKEPESIDISDNPIDSTMLETQNISNDNISNIQNSAQPIRKKRGRPRKTSDQRSESIEHLTSTDSIIEETLASINKRSRPSKSVENILNSVSGENDQKGTETVEHLTTVDSPIKSTESSNKSDISVNYGETCEQAIKKESPSSENIENVSSVVEDVHTNTTEPAYKVELLTKKKRGRPRKTTDIVDSFKDTANNVIGYKSEEEINLITLNESNVTNNSINSEIEDIPSALVKDSSSVTKPGKKRGRKPKSEYVLPPPEENVELPLEESQRGRKRIRIDYSEVEGLLAEDLPKKSKSYVSNYKKVEYVKKESAPSDDDETEYVEEREKCEKAKKYTFTGETTKMISKIFSAASIAPDKAIPSLFSAALLESDIPIPDALPSGTKLPSNRGRRRKGFDQTAYLVFDEEKKVTCVVCKEKMFIEEWSNHNEKKHYGLGWRQGDIELNLDNDSFVKKTLKSALLRNKKLVCYKCNNVCTKAKEFIEHKEVCDGIVCNGDVICAICNQSFPKSSWIKHKLKHNNLAWRVGDIPLNLNEETVVLRILNALYKAKKPLQCETCQTIKKSVVGFLSHRVQCGRQIGEAQITCEICGKKCLPVSMITHIKAVHSTPKPTEILESDYFTVDAPVGKRKAASRALNIIDELKKEEKLYYFKYYVKQLNFEEDDMFIAFLMKELEENKSIKCKIKDCEVVTDNTSLMLEHMAICPLKPKEYYVCNRCYSVYSSEDEIIDHFKLTHDLKVVSDADYEQQYNSDEGEEQEVMEFVNRRKSVVGKDKRKIKREEDLCRQKPWFIVDTSRYNKKDLKLYSHAFEYMFRFCKRHFIHEHIFENLICNKHDWKLMEEENLETYLPPSEVSCDISRRIVNEFEIVCGVEHTFKKFQLFEILQEDDYLTIYCGGPIFCMAWAPTPYTSLNQPQILAVATGQDWNGKYTIDEYYAERTLIQFWSFGTLKNFNNYPEPRLAFCLAFDYSPIWHMEWCPSGCFNAKDSEEWSRVGLMAVAGSNMPVHIYSIPLLREDNAGLFYKAKPVLKLQLVRKENTLKRKAFPTKLSWSKLSPNTSIAVGYSDGTVALYNLNTTSNLLLFKDENSVDVILPYKIIKAHSHFVTVISWIPVECDRWLLTGSYDKNVYVWDLYTDNKFVSKKSRILMDGVWLTYWLSHVTTSEESTPTNGNVVTLQTVYRDYLTDSFNLANSPATVLTMSSNDWLNGFVNGNTIGQIITFFPHQMLSSQDPLRKGAPFRFLMGYAKLIDKTKSPEERVVFEENKQKLLKPIRRKSASRTSADILGDKQICNIYEPLDYHEAVEQYGVCFCDIKTNKPYPLTTLHQDQEFSKPNLYPLQEINKVAFNPNRQASLYYATGYQIGFLRLTYLRHLENDQQIKLSEKYS